MNTKKIQKWWKKNRLPIALGGMATVTAVACGISYVLGKHDGKVKFQDGLIDLHEGALAKGIKYNEIEWPVVCYSTNKYGDLLYEIKAECIGD